MLNLYRNYSKKIENKKIADYNIEENTIKHFPSSVREWNNSIYTFNKNLLTLVPEASKLTMKLIKSYFNLYNAKLENKLRRSNIRKRFRRLSSNRIYISNGVFKHTNNKVIITIYVYNRQKINYTYLMKKKFGKYLTIRLSKKLLLLKSRVQNLINKIEKNKLIVFEIFKNENNTILLNEYKSLYTKFYDIKLYKKLVKRILTKYKKYFLYKQMLYINKSKFNYNYLSYLTYLLKKVYNKNVEFDIINLRYFYLNSDILTESILLKTRRNRKKLVKKLKYLLIRSKINKITRFITYKPLIKNAISIKENLDDTSTLILNNSYKNKKSIKRTVLNLIKYKRVTGVRLEANGRLTRRYTASRSLSKLRYKGNLVNIDSSYLGMSSVFLRGNLRSNLQYTKAKSKTRIGSFGLKGWVSGY